MRKVLDYAIALWKAPVGPAVTALLGLILTAVFLLVFASDLLLILEINIDDLIASFIVCGLGAGLGFILLRRLFPQRGPISLFGDSGVPIPCVKETNTPVHAAEHSQAVKEQATHAVRPGSHIKPVMLGHGSESPATLNTHQSPGIALAVTVIGMTLIVVGRFDGGWQFTSLALLTGGAMAVVLYWVRRQPQNSSIWSYAIPVSGGVIGSAAMIGVGVVMMRFHFLRLFLELVVGAGVVIAVVLRYLNNRTIMSSLVQPVARAASHVTIQTE